MKQIKLKQTDNDNYFTIKNLSPQQMEILAEMCSRVRLNMQNEDMFALASFFDEHGFMGYQNFTVTNNKNDKQFNDFTLELA
jgi:hypothetical protein